MDKPPRGILNAIQVSATSGTNALLNACLSMLSFFFVPMKLKKEEIGQCPKIRRKAAEQVEVLCEEDALVSLLKEPDVLVAKTETAPQILMRRALDWSLDVVIVASNALPVFPSPRSNASTPALCGLAAS